MPRPLLAPVLVSWATLKSLIAAFHVERMSFALGLAFAVFLLALVLGFLAYARVLSPFIYPLF